MAQRRFAAEISSDADWLQQHHIPARGHLLVLPASATPKSWSALPPAEMRRRLAAHIPEPCAPLRSAGSAEWDVVNELRYNEDFVAPFGGLDTAAEWFRQARQENPRPSCM